MNAIRPRSGLPLCSGAGLFAALVGCAGPAAKDGGGAEDCVHGRTTISIVLHSRQPAADPPLLCAPGAPVFDVDGLADCKVLVRFPNPETFDAGAEPPPLSCDDLPGLRPTGRTTEAGDPICEMMQLVRRDRELPEGEEGWFLVALSERATEPCRNEEAVVAFSPGLRVPNGSQLDVDCAFALTSEGTAASSADPACLTTESVARSVEVLAREVGEACEPRPLLDSYDNREVLLAQAASQCASGACLVYQLEGSIRRNCVPDEVTRCATKSSIDERVYCTCRCSTPEGVVLDEGELCTCPSGFSCLDDLFTRPESLAGGYCVRNGTFNAPEP